MRTRTMRGPVSLLGTALVTTAMIAGAPSGAYADDACGFLTRRTVWHLRSVARFLRLHGLTGSPRSP